MYCCLFVCLGHPVEFLNWPWEPAFDPRMFMPPPPELCLNPFDPLGDPDIYLSEPELTKSQKPIFNWVVGPQKCFTIRKYDKHSHF